MNVKLKLHKYHIINYICCITYYCLIWDIEIFILCYFLREIKANYCYVLSKIVDKNKINEDVIVYVYTTQAVQLGLIWETV